MANQPVHKMEMSHPQLIEVLEAAGLDAYIEAPSAAVPEAGKRARVLRPLLQRLLGEPLAR